MLYFLLCMYIIDIIVIPRRGDPPGEGLWLRVRDGVPGSPGGRVPVQAAAAGLGFVRRPLPEKGARPGGQVRARESQQL